MNKEKQLNDENNKDSIQSCSLFVQCKTSDRSQWKYSIELTVKKKQEKEGRSKKGPLVNDEW